jgi:hypothetical protein
MLRRRMSMGHDINLVHPLHGKLVVLMCANYIYTGTLDVVSVDHIAIDDPSIVYETGEWAAKEWKDVQALPTKRIYIERTAVESMFELVHK